MKGKKNLTISPFALKRSSPQDKFLKHMKDKKPVIYTRKKKLTFDWADSKHI